VWERCIAIVKKEPLVQVLGNFDVLSKNFAYSFYEAPPTANDYS
jgi:hypothetical protein